MVESPKKVPTNIEMVFHDWTKKRAPILCLWEPHSNAMWIQDLPSKKLIFWLNCEQCSVSMHVCLCFYVCMHEHACVFVERSSTILHCHGWSWRFSVPKSLGRWDFPDGYRWIRIRRGGCDLKSHYKNSEPVYKVSSQGRQPHIWTDCTSLQLL